MEELGFHDYTDFVEILYANIFLKSKIQVSLKPDKNKGCFDEDLCAYKVSCLILFKMRSVPEKIKAQVLFQNFSEYRAVYMWKHTVPPNRKHMTQGA
jgi:hypothetical protein